MKTLRRMWFYWIDRPPVDYLVAVIAVGVAYLGFRQGWNPIANLTQEARASLTTALAVITAGLLGFGIASISVLFAVPPGPRLAVVLQTVGQGLGRLLMATIRTLGLATLVFVFAVVVEASAPSDWYWLLILGFVVLSAVRLTRLMWLLGSVVATLSHDARDDNNNEQQSEWVNPTLREEDYQIPKREVG